MPDENPQPTTTTPEENPLLSLILNIVLPVFVLTKLSEGSLLGPVWALVIATCLPLGYGIFDWVRRRELNLFSTLGVVSVVLTGSLGLLQAGAMIIAIKEAAIPLVIGGAILYSTRTSKPLVRTLLLSPRMVDVPAIEHFVRKNGKEQDFEHLIFRGSALVALSMLVAAALSFAVAIYTLRSEPGTTEFDKELGHLIYRSLIVAGIPAFLVLLFALWDIVRGLKKITGLETDDIFNPR